MPKDGKDEMKEEAPVDEHGEPIVQLTEEEFKEWQTKGWLSEDGICCFPDFVNGYDPGWIGRIYGPTYEDAKVSFVNGWAKICDADGDRLTWDGWMAKYPGTSRPDPIKQMFLMHKLPPTNEFVDVFVIGKTGRIKPNPKRFKQLSKRPEFQV